MEPGLMTMGHNKVEDKWQQDNTKTADHNCTIGHSSDWGDEYKIQHNLNVCTYL